MRRAPKELEEMQFRIPVPEDKTPQVTDEEVLAVIVSPEEQEHKEIIPEMPLESPTFIEPLKPQEMVAHSETQLLCRVTGNPMPTVSWFLDEVEIKPEDERYRIEQVVDGDVQS